MKKIDHGQALGIFANVGVLVGILFLVYELNQNREMMGAQTRNAVAEMLVGLLALEIADSEFVGMVDEFTGEPPETDFMDEYFGLGSKPLEGLERLLLAAESGHWNGRVWPLALGLWSISEK